MGAPAPHPVRLAEGGRARHHHEGAPPPHPMAGAMDLRARAAVRAGRRAAAPALGAAARTGQLMVREYVDPAQPWCVVVLDRRDALDAEAFESAVEIVASVLWAAAEQDRPARLATTSGTVIDVRPGTSGAAGAPTGSASSSRTPGPRAGPRDSGGAAGRRVVRARRRGRRPRLALHAARYAEAIAFDVSAGSSTGSRRVRRRGRAVRGRRGDPGPRDAVSEHSHAGTVMVPFKPPPRQLTVEQVFGVP